MKTILALLGGVLLIASAFGGAVTSTNDLKLALLPAPSLRMELRELSSCAAAGDFEVPDSGFYLLEFRKAGWFSWGRQSLPGVEMRLDGVHEPDPQSLSGNGGPSDVLGLPFYLKKGRHRLEFCGSGAWRYCSQTYGPRVWWRKPDLQTEGTKTLQLAQEPEGESIFRLGAAIVWKVRRATLDRTAPLAVTLSVVRQRTDEPVFSQTVSLAPGQACAEAAVAFPRDLAGVFDYRLTDDAGAVLSGPWEFAVVDPRPRPLPEKWKNLPPVAEPGDIGTLVDAVDFGREGTGAVHRIRDNAGSSAIVRTGALAYRRSGAYRNYSFWWDLEGKNGGPFRLPREQSYWKDFLAKPDPKRYFMDADWFGFTLSVKHPQVPHLAVFHIPNDLFRRFPIEILDPQTGRANGTAVEVSPAVGEPGTVEVTVPFWPNTDMVDVLMMASSTHGDARQTEAALAKVELYECPDGLPPLAEASAGWQPERLCGWRGEQGNLSPEVCSIPPVWTDPKKRLPHTGIHYIKDYDLTSFLVSWERCGEYNAWLGCNWMSWPIHSYYQMAHVRTERLPWGKAIFGASPKARYRRDTLKLVLLVCEKYGISFFGDTMLSINVPKVMERRKRTLESFATGHGEGEDELVQTMMLTEGVKDVHELEGAFLEDNGYGGNLNPVHPVAHRYLVWLYGELAAAAKDYPAFKGLTLRQWKSCSTTLSACWGSPTAGYDDFTLGVYARETGNAVPAKSLSLRDRRLFFRERPDECAKWFGWRHRKATELQRDILAEIRRVRPDLRLQLHYHHSTGAVSAEEQGMFSDASAVAPERIVQGGRQGNECNALDPVTFKYFDERPGVGSLDDPKRFHRFIWMYPGGLNVAQATLAAPFTTQDFAAALREGPIDIAESGMFWCYPGGHRLMREWMRAHRALPPGDYRPVGRDTAEYVLRASGDVAYLASQRPYPVTVKLAAEAEDLVNGGSRRTFELPSYGLAVIRGTQAWRGKKGDTSGARARLRVRNPYGRAAAQGVLATFKLGAATARGGDPAALRLLRNGRELPLQIDPVDANGNYTTNFAGRVASPDDEVAFTVDFAAGESEAVLDLQLRGAPRGTYASPFAVSNLTVRTPSVEIGFGARGVNWFAVGGKPVYTGCGGTTGVTRRAEMLAYPYEYQTPDKKPYPASPCVVYAAGPVRFLAGYGFGAPRTVDIDLFGCGFKMPVFFDETEHRVWQVVAGSDTLDVLSRIRYSRARRIKKKLYNWVDASWCDPATPMESKRVYSLNAGVFVRNDFVRDPVPRPRDPTGGSFSPGHSSDFLAYFDTRVGAGLMFGIGGAHAGAGGFTFARGLGITQYEPLVPETDGFDFRMAIRGIANEPDEIAFRRTMTTLVRPEVVATFD